MTWETETLRNHIYKEGRKQTGNTVVGLFIYEHLLGNGKLTNEGDEVGEYIMWVEAVCETEDMAWCYRRNVCSKEICNAHCIFLFPNTANVVLHADQNSC